jgi:hypothetical protein
MAGGWLYQIPHSFDALHCCSSDVRCETLNCFKAWRFILKARYFSQQRLYWPASS